MVVCPNNPRVTLCVELHHQYSKDLNLDYQERDDQLIGTAHKFAQRNTSCDVRLLTHDTTPIFTARSIDLPADLISDNWLLPPETTEMEKELASLKAENTRLKKAEPSIATRFTGQSDSQVERYEAAYKLFDPLTDVQVDELMQRLRTRFPIVTDFSPTESKKNIARQTALGAFLSTQVFIPATANEIRKYRDEAYPQWLEQCEEVLRQHHLTLQNEFPVLRFSFLAENVGTRPANDVLITIEACGNFRILPPPLENNDEQLHGNTDETRKLQPRKLSKPPNPPTGRWEPMGRALSQLSYGAHNLTVLPHFPEPTPLFIPTPRDPNAFHYKPNHSSTPQKSFSLECNQWRHGNKEKPFFGEIHVSLDQDTAKGALVCRIQASNLSKPISKNIPVRITVAHASAFESAQTMVQHLLQRYRL